MSIKEKLVWIINFYRSHVYDGYNELADKFQTIYDQDLPVNEDDLDWLLAILQVIENDLGSFKAS